jgi:hypothetical protein
MLCFNILLTKIWILSSVNLFFFNESCNLSGLIISLTPDTLSHDLLINDTYTLVLKTGLSLVLLLKEYFSNVLYCLHAFSILLYKVSIVSV